MIAILHIELFDLVWGGSVLIMYPPPGSTEYRCGPGLTKLLIVDPGWIRVDCLPPRESTQKLLSQNDHASGTVPATLYSLTC